MDIPVKTRRYKADPKEVSRLYQEGMSTKELCEKFGIERNTVDTYRKMENVPGQWNGSTGKNQSKARLLTNDQILELLAEEGLSLPELAERSGLSLPMIHKITRSTREFMQQQLEQEICSRYKSKQSVLQIAADLGVSTTYVRNTLKRNGLEFRSYKSSQI